MARKDLQEGKIVAVRGLGGFLLAVDASNAPALKRLRTLKHRPHKPFAVMARDLTTAHRFTRIPDEAATLLCSEKRPIVILEANDTAYAELPMKEISPDSATLGIMLPVAPLYELLMNDPTDSDVLPFSMLVMTSGNRGGEPICIRNEEALDRLSGIADRYLLHNREINLRNDDSLCALQQDKLQVWRRARGYSPEAIPITHSLGKNILAMGSHLKNTIAFGYKDEIILSPHVGDLDTPEALDSLNEIVDSLPRFLGHDPEVVAVDFHPDYHSSRLGRAIAEAGSLPIIEVQHHHAHALSVMAEHGLEEALVLVFDGTGLGLDGKIWGAELFHIDPDHITHPASFLAAPLPGGDAAILRPARQLMARWLQAGISPPNKWFQKTNIEPSFEAILQQQIKHKLNTPETTAAGRVFDAFSAWLGIAPPHATYDGQSPIRLEALASRSTLAESRILPDFMTYQLNDQLLIDWRSFFSFLTTIPVPDESKAASLALEFHKRMAEAAHSMVMFASEKISSKVVCLSGGVFMNRILCSFLAPMLEGEGYRVLQHQRVPPNDGGISLGQVVCADRETSRRILTREQIFTTIRSMSITGSTRR